MRSKLADLPIIAICWALLASGCGGAFRPEPFIDAGHGPDGEIVLLDTPRMWAYWQADVDRAVSMELAGKGPGGGVSSWNAQWLRVIDANRARENSPRYIDYVIQSRRRAGLPELVGLTQ